MNELYQESIVVAPETNSDKHFVMRKPRIYICTEYDSVAKKATESMIRLLSEMQYKTEIPMENEDSQPQKIKGKHYMPKNDFNWYRGFEKRKGK